MEEQYLKDKENLKRTLDRMIKLCDNPDYVYTFMDVLGLGWEEYKKKKGANNADIPTVF